MDLIIGNTKDSCSFGYFLTWHGLWSQKLIKGCRLVGLGKVFLVLITCGYWLLKMIIDELRLPILKSHGIASRD